MELTQITQNLASENPQDKLRGITALREYDAAIAAPLLLSQVDDGEIIVRSFAAMGLGFKQTPAGYERLTEILQDDADPNVRAEAAAALAKHGEIALPTLLKQFEQDQHWLVQISILLMLPEFDQPEALLQVCEHSLGRSDVNVQTSAAEQLATLAKGPQQEAALELLLRFAKAETWMIRRKVALALRQFDDPRAKQMVQQLRNDSDHRVVAATLENLLPTT